MNLGNKDRGKSKTLQNLNDKGVPQSVKSISKVQLYGHPRLTPFSAGMNSFLNQKDVITNFPTGQKAALIWGDKGGDDFLEPQRQHFGEDLIGSVAKRNWAEFFNGGGVGLFGD